MARAEEAGPGGEEANILVARDVHLTYPGHHQAAVAGASLDVAVGDMIGILGESGSGKTTLAHVLAGILDPSSGFVECRGKPWQAIKRRDPRRRAVQMIFQDPYTSLNPRRTALQTVTEVLDVWQLAQGKIARRDRARQLLTEVGLTGDLVNRRPGRLSGGQCQRLGIARALACQPQLIIADEPTSSLDVSVQAQILNLLLALRESRNISMVIISHDLSVLEYVTDRLYVMYRGHIIEQGPAAEVLEQTRHPYSDMLIASAPGSGRTSPALDPGSEERHAGCVFAHRCHQADDECRQWETTFVSVDPHPVACLHPMTARHGARPRGERPRGAARRAAMPAPIAASSGDHDEHHGKPA